MATIKSIIIIGVLSVAAVTSVAVAALRLYRRLSQLKCEWCSRGLAIYTREGSRCCKKCSRTIDARIRELVHPYPRRKPARSLVPILRKVRR